MNKKFIIHYLKNELTGSETEKLFRWIERNEHNRRYFNTVKNLWVINSLQQPPDLPADIDDLKKRIERKNNFRPTFSVSMRYLTRIAAMLAVPLALGMLWITLEHKAVPPLMQTDNQQISIYAPLCTRAEMVLPDGSKVWLNSGSKLSYPRLFEGTARNVILEGEAYFDVVKNEHYPFIVKTPHKIDVKVKGTRFNLCAYGDDDRAELTLVSGAVDFINENSGKKISLKPLQSVSYTRNDDEVAVKSNVNTAFYTSWKEGVLIFDNVPLFDLSKRLERWYGVTINFEDNDILNYTYTGRFKEEAIWQVLELIQQSSNIAYRVEDKQVFLFRKKSLKHNQ